MKRREFEAERQILAVAIDKLSMAFDEFIDECLDEDGEVIQPRVQAIMKARGCLPQKCKHSFKKKAVA